MTFVVVEGPPFVTSMVGTTVVPAVTLTGPLFTTAMSADVVIAVVSVALLLPVAGSVASGGAVTVSVLTSGSVGRPPPCLWR